MKKKFLDLTNKDQIFVLAVSFVVILLIILGMNSFLINWETDSFTEYKKKQNLLLEVKRSIKLKSKIQTNQNFSSSNLSSTISSVARNFNLTIDRIQPTEEGKVMVSINNADFLDLFNWLKDLKDKAGITAIKVSIKKNAIRENTGVRVQLVLGLYK